MTRWRTLMRGLRRHRSGVAMIEFALAAPLLMTAGLYGAETANQAITQMRLNQIAVMIADHASRVGENSPLAQAQVNESDINDVLYGAHLQGGHMLDFYEHGRVILSSLEVVQGRPISNTSIGNAAWASCVTGQAMAMPARDWMAR